MSKPENIGVAEMKDDRSIVLRSRAKGVNGEVGDAMFVYHPDDPKYEFLLKHLGGLEPGQEKLMPPWLDDE